MRTVGPKYGKLLNKIRQVLPTLDGNTAMDELRANGQLKLDIDGEEVVLLEEDLLIETAQTEGYVSEQDNNITVVLDTNLTDELIEEGFVRELISKIQTMRKEAGFEVTGPDQGLCKRQCQDSGDSGENTVPKFSLKYWQMRLCWVKQMVM